MEVTGGGLMYLHRSVIEGELRRIDRTGWNGRRLSTIRRPTQPTLGRQSIPTATLRAPAARAK
jgi:hypothetical protein